MKFFESILLTTILGASSAYGSHEVNNGMSHIVMVCRGQTTSVFFTVAMLSGGVQKRYILAFPGDVVAADGTLTKDVVALTFGGREGSPAGAITVSGKHDPGLWRGILRIGTPTKHLGAGNYDIMCQISSSVH